MQWFRNLKLNVKILLIVGMFLIVFVLVGLLALTWNFNNLASLVTQQQAEAEVAFIHTRLAEIEQEILLAADILADNATLIEGVELVDERGLNVILARSLSTFTTDLVAIVDIEGVSLVTNAALGEVFASEQPLISLALLGTDITGIVSQVDGDTVTTRLTAAVPIKNQAGTILGALLVGQNLDDSFWNAANFERNSVQYVLLHEGQTIAQTSNTLDTDIAVLDEIYIEDAIQRATNNQVVIGNTIAVAENGLQFGYAHVPLEAGGRVGAVLTVLIDVSQTFQVRNAIFSSLTGIFALLSIALLILIVFTTHRAFVTPLSNIQTVSQKMLEGDYSQRISVNSQDEVGQLGQAFNEMAAAIEYRDNEQIVKLEEQVVVSEVARAEAERSDQVKSAFLASMSHELRTPLNSVINFSKFVARGIMGPVTDRQIDTLNKVIASGQHLLNLINDVLDMSKIESGSLTLFVEDDINPNDILDTVLANGEALIAEKPVAFKIDVQADLPMMRGDRKRLTQIFLNVISNACKFTQEGYVKVTAKAEDDTLHFKVQDTGPGIRKEYQSSVFEAFKQTDAGLKQGEGTGLGMPISKNLTEALGGHLWFESTPEEGTTFFVTLPIKSETLQPVS